MNSYKTAKEDKKEVFLQIAKFEEKEVQVIKAK
jgi:hypothetical protein